MINYSDVQVFFKPSCENVPQASLIKVILLKGVWIRRLEVQNVTCWSDYFDNLDSMKKAIRNRNKKMKPAPL